MKKVYLYPKLYLYFDSNLEKDELFVPILCSRLVSLSLDQYYYTLALF